MPGRYTFCMSNQGSSPPSKIFGSPAVPLSLEARSLHVVRLMTASVAAIAFVAFALLWDWSQGWLIAALAIYEVGHAFFHLRRDRPLSATLLTDILIVSLTIAIVRPPVVAIITPIVYLVAAPMLLTAGRTALRLTLAAVVSLSAASYVVFEFPPAVEWTEPRTLLMVASFLTIFGPLIVWMINATSQQTAERETTRAELDATRTRLEEVFRNAPVGMELTEAGSSDFLAVNPAFADFLGYTEEQLLGLSLTDVVHPDDLGASWPEAERVAAGELDRLERERRYIHADGRVRWAHFSLSVIRNTDGTPRYAIGQAQDITRRKAAEAERDLLLELSLAVAGSVTTTEAMRSVLAGLCNAGGWSIGVLWVPSVTGGMERVHTWAAHPAVDKWADTTAELRPGEGFVGAVTEAGKPIEVPSIATDTRFIARDEAAELGLDVALGVPVLAGEDVVGVLLFLGAPGIDPSAAHTTTSAVVAQLGQALAVKLAEAERDRLAEILEYTTDFAAFADAQGRTRYMNPAGREMLGIGPDDDVTGIVAADIHPSDVARRVMDENVPEAIQLGSWRGETDFLARDGRIIPTSQVILAHYDESGEVALLSTVARDITAQKQLEFQQEEAIRSKDEFIASVSHELRTPLTAVRGFAEILQDPHAELGEKEMRDMIAVIASESADVSDIVEDLLVAARSDIDQLTIAPRPVKLSPLVLETAERVRWGAKTIEVSTDPDTTAFADPLRLRQILRNLMVNAVRYGGDNVQVSVSSDGTDVVVVTVRDDGPGIPSEHRDEIFAPYRRVHDRAGLPGSVGLGLAVSRRLARLMSGDVTYTHDGTWSNFTLQVPLFSGAALHY